MKPVAIIMVALVLGACMPEQDVAQCEVEAIRLYPNNPPKQYDDAATRYVTVCMKAKGYEFPSKRCEYRFDRPGPSALQPGCYKATGWRAWF